MSLPLHAPLPLQLIILPFFLDLKLDLRPVSVDDVYLSQDENRPSFHQALGTGQP